MSKKPEKKKKRVRSLIWTTSFFTLACVVVYLLSPYINRNLVMNTFPFFNTDKKLPFYGENIDMSQILPTSQHYVVNNKGQDLIDIAANLGINLVRITNVQRGFPNNEDSLYTKAQWDQVLNKMQSKGMKAIVLIEVVSNNENYYNPEIQQLYLHLVQEYIDSGVFSNPDVYAVDLKNEPLLTDANVKMLQTAHTMIKAKYPDLKQTIGWWADPKSPNGSYSSDDYNWSNFSSGKKIADIVDFYSIHLYGLTTNTFGIHLSSALKTKVFVSEVENGLQTKKPLLIEEFGEANGDAISDQDTIGSPQLQANAYQGVYQALKEMHSSQLMGSVAFDFYSREQYPDAWAIVKNNGNYLFPAAYILQEYALGKSNPSLRIATVVTSQSYLLTNADNQTTKNLHVFDRIGLKLQLDTNKNYLPSLSDNDILQSTEAFHYDARSDAYYALYQATRKGSVQLNILSDTICSKDINCTSSLYVLNVNIH